ncbi:MarR family winged helix-turn-helix transcriptional regulator [Paenibacillus sp. GCM10012306]|uniref:MarR family winged helix-turn-helix transcriptional regulator n=1 Tax=Paenibacillus sp. GCM10012306 TaxID=3317342 RepID=UPI00361CC9F5
MRNQGLDHSIGFRLAIASRRFTQMFLMRIKDYDLTPEQWSVLYRIRDRDGMIQKEIADRAGKDKPTTTRILDLLEEKGYITKRSGESDRRSYHVYITESGRRVAEAIAPIEHQTDLDATEVLTEEEYLQLMDMLERVSNHAALWIENGKV